jgi:4-amino-4-deoxy-L-arabinose transferase-like glycosyltransferase
MPENQLRQNNPEYSRPIIVCCVILLSAVTSGWMLGEVPMQGHECFVSVTAREMLENNDWVVPRYNNNLRIEKPPLNYWLVAATSKFTGGVDELAARIPSMLMAMLSTAAVIYFVSQYLTFRIAVMAALVWSTSLGFVRYGHSARPEMALTSFTAIALLSFYSASQTTHRKKQIVYAVVFWVSFAMAMLAKGPAPLPLIGLPVFLYLLLFGKWKIIPKMLPIMGPVIFLLIVLPWPTLLASRLAQTSEYTDITTFWKKEFIDRFTGQQSASRKPFYYYAYVMFQHMMPWVAFVPMTLAAPLYKIWGTKQKTMMFFWLWFVADVVFMSLSGGKRTHYILPAMPAMAILVGILLEDMIFTRQAYSARFSRNILLFHGGAVAAAVFVVPVFIAKSNPNLLQPAIILAVIISIALVVSIILFSKGRNNYACVVLFAGYCVFLMVAFVAIVIPQNKNRYTKKFAIKIASQIPASNELIAYRDVTARFVHYFGRAVPVITDLSETHMRYQQGDWIVATGDLVTELVDDGRFRITHQYENAELHGDEIVEAAIFHLPTTSGEPANQ